MLKSLLAVLILLFWPLSLWADIVTTTDGETYEGKVLSGEGEKVVLEMDIGTIKFYKEEVASIEKGDYELNPPEPPKEDWAVEKGGVETSTEKVSGVVKEKPSTTPGARKKSSIAEKKRPFTRTKDGVITQFQGRFIYEGKK